MTGNQNSESLKDAQVRSTGKQLLDFIDAYSSIRYKVKTDYRTSGLSESLEDIRKMNLPGVEVNTRGEGVVLSVVRPLLPKCPEPPAELLVWLKDGWRDHTNLNPTHFESLSRKYLKEEGFFEESEDGDEDRYDEEELEERRIFFQANPARVEKWKSWAKKRELWISEYNRAYSSFLLYTKLYEWKSILDKEGFQKGSFLCNGFVRSEDESINYPLLFQRVSFEIDTTSEQTKINVILTDEENTRIASEILRQVKDEEFNFEAFRILRDSIDEFGIDLLDIERLSESFRILASNLSSKCIWVDEYDKNAFNQTTAYLFFSKPILFLTDLPTGVKDTVEKIKDLIDEGEPVPSPLKHLLCGYDIDEQIEVPKDPNENAPIERIATVGGESKDVLLALPANRDQLEIARKVSYADAILVQGPPGTGKTHTIANLLCSLLANGQRVLVTSATDKALTVLRDKLPEVIQPLCVTLLNTKGGTSAQDLKRSVEGICETLDRRGFDSDSLTRKDQVLTKERLKIIQELTEIRKGSFDIRKNECSPFECGGEWRTLTEWAKWLKENSSLKEILPDPVTEKTLPLSLKELESLYQTNSQLTLEDESALRGWLPTSHKLPTPETVQEYLLNQEEYNKRIIDSRVHEKQFRHAIEYQIDEYSFQIPTQSIPCFRFDENAATLLCPAWLRAAQVDGMVPDDAGNTIWDKLIQKAENFINITKERHRNLDHPFVSIPPDANLEALTASVHWHLENAPDGEISLRYRLFGGKEVKNHQIALNQVQVGEKKPQSKEAFTAILSEIAWIRSRNEIICSWDNLIASSGGPKFSELTNRPEVEIPKYLALIKEALHWWQDFGLPILKKVASLGIDTNKFFGVSQMTSNDALRDAVWNRTHRVLIPVSRYLACKQSGEDLQNQRQRFISAVTPPSGVTPAPIVYLLQKSIVDNDKIYEKQLIELKRLQQLKPIAEVREKLLRQLATVAPNWSELLRTHKEGWTQSFVPNEVTKAILWNTVLALLDTSIDGSQYEYLQSESRRLAKEFRSVSAELAAVRAWLHLARRLERQPNLLQSLRGWMATVQKIGKGTGKKAPRLQVQARQQAKDCQLAVPIWVMTTQRALTTLNPKEKFDVIIVDEASQSDLTSLAILFMGKRVIVVGDDQQVSPMGIGIQDKDIAYIQREYLKNIRNAPLYDENASLYDIIKTVSSPVLLREHFRCAPEIIGFSNWLSYDGKIMPLRDMSNCSVRPHLVSYRVKGERTSQDMNLEEAKAIVALIASCIEQPEYEGKTFGVISMFSGKGQGQVELIDRMLKEALTPREYEKRRITVGISANFQGDERDVIFLSLVQSRIDPDKLMHKEGFGRGDSTKKRYNVAVSRARDQLWVIHSFEPDADLSGDDIRRRLLMHVRNPYQTESQRESVTARTESPFEKAVAEDLLSLGYNLEPQHSVGCYRLDFVVRDGDRAVALECDGERYHATAEKIAEDMERQAILERSGWTFVRIRGSEYYRDPKAAISHICAKLADFGIHPNYGHTEETSQPTELLDRVKIRASEILEQKNFVQIGTGLDDEIYADDGILKKNTKDATEAIENIKTTLNKIKSTKEQLTENRNIEDISIKHPDTNQDLASKSATPNSTNIYIQKRKPETTHANTEKPLQLNHSTDTRENRENTIFPEKNGTLTVQNAHKTQKNSFSQGVCVKAASESTTNTNESLSQDLPETNPPTFNTKTNQQKITTTKKSQITTTKAWEWNTIDKEKQVKILEQDRYMFNIFESRGWDISDHRSTPGGCLWVIAPEKEFIPLADEFFRKFGLRFCYTANYGRRGRKPGWWLQESILERARKL